MNKYSKWAAVKLPNDDIGLVAFHDYEKSKKIYRSGGQSHCYLDYSKTIWY